jgi:hypothetical protein
MTQMLNRKAQCEGGGYPHLKNIQKMLTEVTTFPLDFYMYFFKADLVSKAEKLLPIVVQWSSI